MTVTSDHRSLVLASGNAGKAREFARLISGYDINLVLQSTLQVPFVPETGTTFLENALIKARHCTRHTGLPSLADDSGLIVPALGYVPGVLSARYAGPAADDEANTAHLLEMLAGYTKEQDRRAFFHCTLVLLRSFDDPDPLLAQGRWHGHIANSPQGEGGFGYDPVFICDEHQKAAAELPLAVKNEISHRGQAMQALRGQLKAATEIVFDHL